MNEFVVIRNFVLNTEEITNLTSALPFVYDSDNFKVHKRYLGCDDDRPEFLINLVTNICINLYKRTMVWFKYGEDEEDTVMINKYEEHEMCGWHRDYNRPWCMGENKAIRIILTLGPDKIFKIKNNKSGEVTEYLLHSGDVVIIGEHFDELYEHSVPAHNDGKTRYTFMITFETSPKNNDTFFKNILFMN